MIDLAIHLRFRDWLWIVGLVFGFLGFHLGALVYESRAADRAQAEWTQRHRPAPEPYHLEDKR